MFWAILGCFLSMVNLKGQTRGALRYHKEAIFKKVRFGPLRVTKRVENGAHHIFLGLWGGFSTFFYLRIAFDNILKNVTFSHTYDRPYRGGY